METWRDIPGFDGDYQISSLGRLKSFKKEAVGRVLSVKNSKGWYLTVNLICRKEERHTHRIHRLVAQAFVPNPENKPEVNHKDTDKQNNRADNLEWVTRLENAHHAIKNNPNILKGMNRYNKFTRPKKVQQLTLEGKVLAEYPNATAAAEATGVCGRNILQVANRDEFSPGRTRKQAGGYAWRFRPDMKRGEASGY